MGVYMESIYNLNLDDLEVYLIKNSYKKYRAVQIMEWLYIKRVDSFSLMTNLSKDLIEKLEHDFYFDDLKIIKRQDDKDVSKFLIELNDKNLVEAVLMNHDYGNSLCISSEVGCNMACSFCESGRIKKIRNVTSGEMVLELMTIEKAINTRISHVVIMGIGEPFDNYSNFCDFISIVNYQKGINLGSRHITVSTCGIVPKIYEFSEFPYQVNLAISLHASNNELRSKLMPINKVYPLEELMKAIENYISKTNRRVTFEYIMLKGVNDKIENAIELSNLLKEMNCYVNLIPYNTTSNDSIFKKSDKEQIIKFYDTLKKNNINVTIRKEFGSKVMAACGQLRDNYEEELK